MYSVAMAGKRMSDRETEKRMLESAVSLVNERGVSTALESIAFDEVIREAGVSRTSAYRRWPQRDLFYGEVLVELARGTALPGPQGNLQTTLAQLVLDRASNLGTARELHALLVELLRVSISADLDLVISSPQWRTYRILLASYQGIVDPQVRQAVTEALAGANQRVTDLRARVYAQFTALLGYRLRAPLSGPEGFEFMSQAAGATMTGVLARHSLGDTTVESPRPMRAFGVDEVAEWAPGAYMVAATVLTYIEPDPGVQWDRQRIDDVVAAMRSFE